MLHKHHMYYVSDMHILHASHTNIITEQVAVNGHTMYARTYVCLSSGTSPLVKNTVCCPICAHKLRTPKLGAPLYTEQPAGSHRLLL